MWNVDGYDTMIIFLLNTYVTTCDSLLHKVVNLISTFVCDIHSHVQIVCTCTKESILAACWIFGFYYFISSRKNIHVNNTTKLLHRVQQQCIQSM